MSGLLRQSWLRHDSTCPAIGAALPSGITAFPTLGPLRIAFTLGVTRYTLYGVGCRLYHNGKNSSHGMIVVWLLQSDTNLQLFYESKKSFLKYFHFQPLNLHFQPLKLTFRAWERPQKRNNKCSLCYFNTSCRKGKARTSNYAFSKRSADKGRLLKQQELNYLTFSE